MRLKGYNGIGMINNTSGLTFYLYLLLAYIFCSSLVLGDEVYCPSTVSVKQQIEKPPTKWQVTYKDVKHNLSGITFYDGPPEMNAVIFYNYKTESIFEGQIVWTFNKPYPSGIWLSCNYYSTNILLSRKLTENITECRVTYFSNILISGSNAIKNIECE